MRPPVPKPTREEISTLKALLAGAGLEVRPEAEIRQIEEQL
jgi:hypothetical protein